MRVLMAITKGEVGGAQEHVKILARGLSDMGHEVGVMASVPSPLSAWAAALGLGVFPWRSISGTLNPLADLQARAELRQVIGQWRPDILHLNSSKAGAVGAAMLRPPRGVTIFTCHHAPFGAGRRISHRLVSRPVYQTLLPRMDGIISVGARDMPVLTKIAPRVPLCLIRNAVPTQGPPVSLGPLRPVALWVARMASPKDPLLAVRVWERVAADLPDARLIMCGTGPLGSRVERAVAESPARASIDYKGFVEDLRPVREQASLYLLCSRVEGGISMATLEAMTDGLVPVVSDVGDAPQLEEYEAGICVRVNRPGPFARAVVDLLADPGRFESLRSNALHYSREDRTPHDLTIETEAFFREVLGSRGIVT